MGVPHGIRLTSVSTTMQKTRSPSSSKSRRIIQNWWKGKSAPSSPCGAGKGFWLPEADNTWCNTKNKIVLSPTSLLHLTEVERVALQKIALGRLQDINLGVPITIPKDGMNTKSKKSRFLLKRRAVSTNVIDTLSPTSPNNSYPPKTLTDSKTSGWVFGIPLAKCIANDIELRRLASVHPGPGEPTEMTHSPLRNRKSSSSSGGALSNDESLSEPDCSRTTRSNLVDALLLPVSSRLDSNRLQTQEHPHQQQHSQMPTDSKLRVPYVVNVCCQHLQTHGLGVLGIFRIGSSKKRTIQLRDEFDTGQEVQLTEEHNPHDVGAVLKEFFRDLPDPLLTKNLYSAFVATRKLKNDQERIRSVNLLVALLPPSNRDTLWTLLSFLNTIARHSTDFVDDQGNKVPGNKMDPHNLATLFGPNILHKAKGGAFQVESLERAEERAEVISVVKEMIEHQADIFELSAELHDETLRDLLKTNPEDVDYILQCRTINFSIDPDPESSSSVGCEESDTSSMPPHSPGGYWSSETDALYPRSFIDAFHPPSTESRTLIELLQSHASSSSSTPSLPSIAIGIATPSGLRPPAPAGCDTSGSAGSGGPVGRRKPHPEMRIEITTTEEDSLERPSLTVPITEDWNNGPRRSPGVPHGSRAEARKSTTSIGGKRQTLAVPTKYSGKDSDYSSSTGLSPRASPRSSRSLSSSSPSPEPLWSQGSGGSSPDQNVPCYLIASSPSSPGWSSSSKHRPLGLSSETQLCGSITASTGGICSLRQPTSTSPTGEASADWHETRWTGWGRMGKQKGEELHEQETLV